MERYTFIPITNAMLNGLEEGQYTVGYTDGKSAHDIKHVIAIKFRNDDKIEDCKHISAIIKQEIDASEYGITDSGFYQVYLSLKKRDNINMEDGYTIDSSGIGPLQPGDINGDPYVAFYNEHSKRIYLLDAPNRVFAEFIKLGKIITIYF